MIYLGIPKAIATPIGFSAPDYGAFEQRATSFESVAAFRNREYELSGVDQPERIFAARVSASLFTTLRVAPALGRGFTRDEDEGRQPVAVLSDLLWRRKFGADPGIIGRPIVLDRMAYTVVGVMDADFTFPNRGTALNNVPAQVFIPIAFTDRERRAFGSMYNNSVVARLKPGVTPQQGDAEVREIVRAAATENYPAGLRGLAQQLSASLTPLRDETVGRVRTLLYVAFAAVVVVLLIACADLANLMLTRAITRQREMAVRSALGAGRGPLIRLSLVESALLAILGSLLGLVVMRWVVAALVRLAPETLPRLNEVGFDPACPCVHGRSLYRNSCSLRVAAGPRGVTLRFVGHAQGSRPLRRRGAPAATDLQRAGRRAVRPGRDSAYRRWPSCAKFLEADERGPRISRRRRPHTCHKSSSDRVSTGLKHSLVLYATVDQPRTAARRVGGRGFHRSAAGHSGAAKLYVRNRD